MAPSSARARRSRRGSNLEEASDGALPDAASPSRPARKRRRTEASPPKQLPARKRKSAADAPDGPVDEDTNEAEGLLNAVIASLNTASYPVNVAVEHGNAKLEREYKHGVQAYAKIAGANWTYYVKTLKIVIGRPPDVAASGSGTVPQSSPVAAGSDSVVDIDLGPGKVVSRAHATIEYQSDGPSGWQIVVVGRNGVKINEQVVKCGLTHPLTSGDVLEIGGTQMMFVTPNDGPRIHPLFLPKSGVKADAGENGVEQQPPLESAADASRARRSMSAQKRPTTATSATSLQAGHARTPTASQRPSTPRQGRGSMPEQDARTRPSPAYNRGLMLETTEEIDYSQESAKDLKPPYSYATMIGQAIMASEDEKLTLNAIYQWIMDKYAFYRRSQSGWQNSIRHNLSLNKAFEKIPRRTDEPGKGMKWQIVPAQREEFLRRNLRPSTKGFHRTSSAPHSPAPRDTAPPSSSAMAATGGPVTGLGLALDDGREMPTSGAALGLSPGSVTPPRQSSYPVSAKEAYTPERGSHPPGSKHLDNGPGFADGSPLPISRSRAGGLGSSTFSDATQGSPLSLPSSTYLDESRPMITPAPRRQEVHLGPPSTVQVPSTYLPLSSPAPFWKYVDFGSTPAKPVPDISPTKTGGRTRVENSSPPRPPRFTDAESPSKTVKAKKTADRALDKAGENTEDNVSDDDGPLDDIAGGIDLARGFQPIGSFQSKMTNAAV